MEDTNKPPLQILDRSDRYFPRYPARARAQRVYQINPEIMAIFQKKADFRENRNINRPNINKCNKKPYIITLWCNVIQISTWCKAFGPINAIICSIWAIFGQFLVILAL